MKKTEETGVPCRIPDCSGEILREVWATPDNTPPELLEYGPGAEGDETEAEEEFFSGPTESQLFCSACRAMYHSLPQ